MDLSMDVLFAFIHTQSQSESQSLSDGLFHHLLSIFDTVILPTYKSKYVQFLLYFYISNHPGWSFNLSFFLFQDSILFFSSNNFTHSLLSHDYHSIYNFIHRESGGFLGISLQHLPGSAGARDDAIVCAAVYCQLHRTRTVCPPDLDQVGSSCLEVGLELPSLSPSICFSFCFSECLVFHFRKSVFVLLQEAHR